MVVVLKEEEEGYEVMSLPAQLSMAALPALPMEEIHYGEPKHQVKTLQKEDQFIP